MTHEAELQETMCRLDRSMFERGLSSGLLGNLSARLADGFLMTATNACLGSLDPMKQSKLYQLGRHISGDKPTTETLLYLSYYEVRPLRPFCRCRGEAGISTIAITTACGFTLQAKWLGKSTTKRSSIANVGSRAWRCKAKVADRDAR